MTDTIDTLYADDTHKVSDFVFDEKVSRVFPNMIRRSVPGYDQILSSLSLIAARYAKDNTNLYDLGCSLGAALLAMRRGIKEKPCRIIGIDNSKAMLDRCRERIIADDSPAPVTLMQTDISDTAIDNASIVVLNFTLQFIPLTQRLPLLEKIYNGLRPGGILVLSEKLAFDEAEQNILEPLQLDFKMANGYSSLEISRKREAIANVLIPESFNAHETRLKKAGFNRVLTWFQHFNFSSILAIK